MFNIQNATIYVGGPEEYGPEPTVEDSGSQAMIEFDPRIHDCLTQICFGKEKGENYISVVWDKRDDKTANKLADIIFTMSQGLFAKELYLAIQGLKSDPNNVEFVTKIEGLVQDRIREFEEAFEAQINKEANVGEDDPLINAQQIFHHGHDANQGDEEE